VLASATIDGMGSRERKKLGMLKRTLLMTVNLSQLGNSILRVFSKTPTLFPNGFFLVVAPRERLRYEVGKESIVPPKTP